MADWLAQNWWAGVGAIAAVIAVLLALRGRRQAPNQQAGTRSVNVGRDNKGDINIR